MKEETFTPNPTGDQDKGWAILAVCWALVLFALVSTILRIYVRARLTGNLGSDDAVIGVAMATTILGAGLITAEVLNGLGRHEYYLTTPQRSNLQALAWADWVQVFITLGLTKISICLFLLRIIEQRTVEKAMWALIGFTSLFSAVCVFLFMGICRPLRAYWAVGQDGHCMSNLQVSHIVIAHGVLSVLTDLVCAALPAIFLRKIQINRRTKIGLCILMGLGVITAVCCTVRTALSGALTDKDQSWATTSNVGWRLPEVNIGIVCANAPILRPLYLFLRGRLATQRRATAISTMTATTDPTSKERTWPSNARRKDSIKLESASRWNRGRGQSAGTTETSVEMGLPIHGTPSPDILEDGGPLKEKPYFSLGSGRR
ncbi:hypothetical protein ACLMJK_008196 [Lecanora helva]